jgi:hypothetical protein
MNTCLVYTVIVDLLFTDSTEPEEDKPSKDETTEPPESKLKIPFSFIHDDGTFGCETILLVWMVC